MGCYNFTLGPGTKLAAVPVAASEFKIRDMEPNKKDAYLDWESSPFWLIIRHNIHFV